YAAGDEAPLALKQAPVAPPEPEAAVQTEDLSEARQEEPRSTAPNPTAGGAPDSPQPLAAQQEQPQHETETESLPVHREAGAAPPARQRLDRKAGELPGSSAPLPAAPAPAPPPPPAAAEAAAPQGFVAFEEITVTGVASEARSSSTGSSAGLRRSADGFVFTERAPLSPFGLDVGTASYETARHSLGEGELPGPGSVRVEEWVNYFHYGDRAPLRTDFNVTAEGAPSPFTPGAQYRLVRFNIRGREVDPRNRVIAREAWAQVEWNATMVERYRLLGFENGGSAGPRRGLQSAGDEIEAGHSVTALYEIKLQPGIEEEADRRLASLRLRWRSPETGRVSETETPLMGFHIATGWEAASPALRLAAVVAEMAEILAGSPAAREGSLDTVFQEAQRIGGRFPGDAEVAEFVSLAGKAARLKGRAAEEPR
ncbi:MAG TPA: von Willebrand factor type A domain-containing protein, partial [Thermoanaerobaculia bacterium]|nr:von Willebrand factor type A domain-containing protein [Thermoanaerobaculia bacterium]